MSFRAPVILTDPPAFFLQPRHPKQRQYEALRAYYVQGRSSQQAARAFGYSPGAFRVLCYSFLRDPKPAFFLSPRTGPRSQPKKSAARSLVISLRKQNHSVYEISQALKEQKVPLSPTAVREVLKAEGFAALPRRLDDERPQRPQPTVEPIADARAFSLAPRKFFTRCGGLFLFLPELVRLEPEQLAHAARLPGSKMIPPAHALRACLALKLWSIERKSHVMALAADEGLALFSGLNATPKKSYLSEYSCRITPRQTDRLLAAWHDQLAGCKLLDGSSFNLDFHSVPYYGQDPIVQKHYISARSRSQPGMLVFLAQDEHSQTFCYSNADLRKGEEAEEIFRFIRFWEKAHGQQPRHLVFDSKLTTQANLARLDRMKIDFITLRRRSRRMLIENSLSDAVRFFHMDALSSAVGLKVDFDMTLLVVASGLYRLLARQMRGYAEAQSRQIFRDLLDLPAQVEITEQEVRVEFHRRAHLPIVLASGLCDKPVAIPWWSKRRLRLTTYTGR